MNDDHPTAPDPGAPYRHPELSPQQAWAQYKEGRREHLLRMGIPCGEWVPDPCDLMHSAEARLRADRFSDWFVTLLSFDRTSTEDAKAYLPDHLRPFWDHVERQAQRRERAERGEV